MKIGGDPEDYMEAPTLNVGGGGGAGEHHPSFIASLLDLLGINHQVAKAPKQAQQPASTPATAPLPARNTAGETANLSTPSLPILDHVSRVTAPSMTVQTPFGLDSQTWLGGYRSTAPATMQMIDPNAGF